MSRLVAEVLKRVESDGLAVRNSSLNMPPVAVNKVELYLSFHGNDRCAHCVTCSGPHRQEMLLPDDARKVLRNVRDFSILTRLRQLSSVGHFRFARPRRCRELDTIERPPSELTAQLIGDYADCLMGKGYTSEWVGEGLTTTLPFGRPSIRLSGGEFFTWPHKLGGKPVEEDRRLELQCELLQQIRDILPEYDIFILTNGRFASSQQRADKVLAAWSGCSPAGGGRTRLSISIDVFHRPPPGSTVEEMLNRIWVACRKVNMGAPFLYGVTNARVGLVGRALTQLGCCKAEVSLITDMSGSGLNPRASLCLDPVDLAATDGCNELKGFFCETEYGIIPVNNIVVTPEGRMAYCCACVGDYGDFVHEPRRCLRNVLLDPVSVMLRRHETAVKLLNIAVKLDPSIKVFGTGENAAITGSTCYQMLTGRRPGCNGEN